MPPTPRQQRLVKGGILAVGAALLGIAGTVLATFPPSEMSFYPKCQLHSLTGLHCPGCGLTRFASAVLRGDLSQAAAYNAVGMVAVPIAALWGLQQVWAWLWGVRPRRWFSPKSHSRATAVFLAVLAVFFVLRNVPVEPFTLLAPHELTR